MNTAEGYENNTADNLPLFVSRPRHKYGPTVTIGYAFFIELKISLVTSMANQNRF